MNISCIIVDDDKISIKTIQKCVERVEFLCLKGTFLSPVDAYNFIVKEKIDLIFLDIEMPELSGFDLLKQLNYKPFVILISSNEKYALQSYDFEISDYLMKPITFSRFLKSVTTCKVLIENQKAVKKEKKAVNNIFAKKGSLYSNINVEHINWIESLGDYIKISTPTNTFVIHSTMKHVENLLPEHFIRVHKSYIVNEKFIESLQGTIISVNKHIIPIGKSYRKTLLTRLNLI